MPNAEFFLLGTSQRFGLAMLPEAGGEIRVKLVEHGEKELTSVGRQQVARLAEGLEKEFGRERVTLT